MKKEIVIIAPHPDDEIIGCFEILKEHKAIIIYTEEVDLKRKEEARNLREHIDIKSQLFLRSVPETFLNKNTTMYFPDPIYETHPAHRIQGAVGEQFARGGLDVVFYSVNMIAPYCHEVEDSEEKEKVLNLVYSSQSDLWKYDKKYVLFEGRCKWLF